MSKFLHKITARFLHTLLSTPAGRAHLLNSVADAESSDEGAIFERLLASVDDPKLRQMIGKHHEDEIRHGELLRAQLRRTGIEPGPVPEHLRILPRINALVGGMMDRPITCDRDIMDAYLLLLVIEERALEQFGQFIPAFDAIDRETADTFRGIERDEARHLRYCHAISRRYAPSDAVWTETLARFRKLEAQAFAENSSANMAYSFEHGLHPAGVVEQAAWRALLWLGRLAPRGTAAAQDPQYARAQTAAA
jgi:tRNA isopentenyl-2-thiomethyl-A-37 hydroxylase MiaE